MSKLAEHLTIHFLDGNTSYVKKYLLNITINEAISLTIEIMDYLYGSESYETFKKLMSYTSLDKKESYGS